MCKSSLSRKESSIKEKILKNLTSEKIKYLINIIIDKTYFNTNINDINVYKNQIKFKYNSCSLLINILCDTEKYAEIIVNFIKEICYFIYFLFDFYNISKGISFLILITHYQWLINILKKKNLDINIPILVQIYLL